MAQQENSTSLMTLTGMDESRALSSFADMVDGQSFEPAFQGVKQIGGRQGGALEANRGTDEEVDLPEGRRGFLGVYLGYRCNFVAWGAGLKSADEATPETEEASAPVYSGAVSPLFDPIHSRLLKDACSAYQFTAKINKGTFDFVDSEAGHIRANCELLIFYPEANGAITVATPFYYDSVFGKTGTLSVLKGLVDKEAGGILPIPYKITPITEEKTVKGNAIGVHHIHLEKEVDTKSKAVFQAFKEWSTMLVTDEGAGQMGKIGTWLKCEDHPMSEATIGYLKNARALGN